MRDDETTFRAASMYFLQQQTMEVIARTLGVSRSTVSRMLGTARSTGMVRISLQPPQSRSGGVGHQLAAVFGLKVTVVPVRTGSAGSVRLEQVAMVAANQLQNLAREGMTMAVAWGTTLTAVAKHLRYQPLRGAAVVQLNGADNTEGAGAEDANNLMTAVGGAFGASVINFPVPAFFDYPQTREALWRERSVQRVLERQRHADLAVFGVGGLDADVPSRVYSGGYLSEAEMRHLREDDVVGDVCTVFLRQDGSYRDVEMNRRSSGPSPADLRRLPRRLCIAAGEGKVEPLVAALRARVATDLVVDEQTAHGVLALVGLAGEGAG